MTPPMAPPPDQPAPAQLSPVLNGRDERDVLHGLPRKDGLAVAAMWLGIASLLVLGLVAGPLAVILGVRSLGRMKRDPALEGRGTAIAGIVLGAVGFVLTAIFVAYYVL